MISGILDLKKPGELPLDRVIAPLSAGVTGLIMAWLTLHSFRRKQSITT
jgi:hypothetical protein